MLAGYPEPATDQLPFYEKQGRLRSQPLRPTDHPERILADLEISPGWLLSRRYRKETGYGDGGAEPAFYDRDPFLQNQVRTLVKTQILALLAPLYPSVVKIAPPFDVHSKGFRLEFDTTKWDAVMADLRQHPVRWNPATEAYERRR